MEAAGTIVGTLSLGITVCDGIIKYCRSWRNQDDDVRALTVLTERLKQLLEDLDNRLQPHSSYDPRLLQRVKDSIQDCAKYIDAAVRLSDKYTSGRSSGRKGKAMDVVHKLKYPFERKTLDELRDIIVAFRGNINTALQILTIDLSLTDIEAVETVRRESSSMHERTLEGIQSASMQITQSFAQKLAQSLPETENSIKLSLAQRIDSSTVSIENAISQSSIVIRDGMQSYELQLKSIAESLARLQPLQGLEEHCRTPLHQDIASGSRRKRARRNVHSSLREDSSPCNCKPVTGIQRFYSSLKWGFEKRCEAYLIHDRNCPLWYTSRKNTNYQVNLLFLQRLRIFGLVQVGINPYTAFHGLNISQNLSCRYVVSEDAPSFRVLRKHLCWPRGPSDIAISDCVRDLRIVFRSAHGSPQDTLNDGRNLLDMTLSYQSFYYSSYPSVEILSQFIRELTRMGTEFRETDYIDYRIRSSLSIIYGDTHYGQSLRFPMHSLSESSPRSRKAFELLSWLVREGFGLSFSGYKRYLYSPESGVYPWHGFKDMLDAQRHSEDFAAAMECGLLSMAVLRQDENSVEKILWQRPTLLSTERNILGHTAIHLAIGWPIGLRILLAAADESTWQWVDDSDNQVYGNGFDAPWSTPLDYAIALGCVESIKLLADTELAFDFDWNFCVGTKALDPFVSDVVRALILERLQQLHSFTLEILPLADVQALQIERFQFFDSKARSLLHHLHMRNIPIPRKFCRRRCSGNLAFFSPEFGGIFHQGNLHPNAAKAFFEAGILSVDYEVGQITPLMTIEPSCRTQYHSARFFGLVEFFVSKGARLDRDVCSRYVDGTITVGVGSYGRYQVLHRIASMCWYWVLRYPLVFKFFEEDIVTIVTSGSTKIWRGILGHTSSDPCNCACSLNGCRPISRALKGAFGFPYCPMISDSIKQNQRPQDDRLKCLLLLLENLEGQRLEEDVVRFLTFMELRLTHTCCEHIVDFYPGDDESCGKMIRLMDEAEVHEIQDEEAQLIDKLDCLVEQFMKQFHELGLPLTTFLREHWKPTMQAELLAKDALLEEDKALIKEIGVKILEDDEIDIEEESDDAQESDDGYDEWIESIARGIK